MQFFDTHSHLDFDDFASATERRFAVNRAQDAGICGILIPAFSPRSWPALEQTADELRQFAPGVCIHTALGIHPWAIADLTQCDIDAALTDLRKLLMANSQGPVAIGECGLDFGQRGAAIARSRQLDTLAGHLDLARTTGFPLVIHCVRAFGPLLDLVRTKPIPPSILHSFSGSAEVAKLLCQQGHYISFASAVTLPSARRVKAAARAIPLDRLLIETDSPDQLPYPRKHHAPRPSEPAFVVDIAQAIADIRGISLAHVAEATLANTARVLRLDASLRFRGGTTTPGKERPGQATDS